MEEVKSKSRFFFIEADSTDVFLDMLQQLPKDSKVISHQFKEGQFAGESFERHTALVENTSEVTIKVNGEGLLKAIAKNKD